MNVTQICQNKASSYCKFTVSVKSRKTFQSRRTRNAPLWARPWSWTAPWEQGWLTHSAFPPARPAAWGSWSCWPAGGDTDLSPDCGAGGIGRSASMYLPWRLSPARHERACWCRGCVWVPSRPRRVFLSEGSQTPGRQHNPQKSLFIYFFFFHKFVKWTKKSMSVFFFTSPLAFICLHMSDTPAA